MSEPGSIPARLTPKASFSKATAFLIPAARQVTHCHSGPGAQATAPAMGCPSPSLPPLTQVLCPAFNMHLWSRVPSQCWEQEVGREPSWPAGAQGQNIPPKADPNSQPMPIPPSELHFQTSPPRGCLSPTDYQFLKGKKPGLIFLCLPDNF